MNAIILAAGIGSRLRPLTYDIPKCLVRVSGKPILQWQLEAYQSIGVEDIYIVTGYKSEQVEEFCRDRRFKVNFIKNSEFETTNNMYSFALAAPHIKGPSFVSNADVVFDGQILHLMAHHPFSDLIAVQVGAYNDESMKVVVDGELVSGISKSISKIDAFGVSIDVYKFSHETLKALLEVSLQYINSGRLDLWTEVAIDQVVKIRPIKPLDIGSLPWAEIDNLEDLALAESLFAHGAYRE